MKNIVVSALVLMLFAGVAGTIQAIHASRTGLFSELYQPAHPVLTKKDVFHQASNKKQYSTTTKREKINRKEIAKNPLHTEMKIVEPLSKYTVVKNLETIEPSEIYQEVAAPLIKKGSKKPRKFKASMFSRGAMDEEYLEEAKPDSVTVIP